MANKRAVHQLTSLPMIEPVLIDSIYEAAVLVDTWPDVLTRIATLVGAKGAMYTVRGPQWSRWASSPSLERDLSDYIAAGWTSDPAHSAPLLAELHPGFRAEIDYRSADEIANLPVHREFMDPRGLVAGAGTIIQGAGNDIIQVAVEGFPSHQVAKAAIPTLDVLRPHLARALTLSALRSGRCDLIVESLALAGVAAAIVAEGGWLKATNSGFDRQMGRRLSVGRAGPRIADAALFAKVEQMVSGTLRKGLTQSIAIPASDDAPFVLHLLPIRGRAKDLCQAEGALLIIANSANTSVPDADLLRLLYDLTPAEARLTRLFLEGSTIQEAALKLKIGGGTARSHFKSVFLKTGVSRQAELMRLLLGLGTAKA